MTPDGCDERRLVAFIAGELDEAGLAGLDAHLLACEGCWAAVLEDRRGREAAESLRERAPSGVRARLEGAAAAARPAHRWERRAARRAAALVAVAAAAVAAAALSIGGGRPADPTALAAVVLSARSDAPSKGGGVAVHVWHATGASGAVVVAESASPFPMPADARAVRVDEAQAWVVRRGRVHVLCVMGPHHALLAGPVPDAELASVARASGLLS